MFSGAQADTSSSFMMKIFAQIIKTERDSGEKEYYE